MSNVYSYHRPRPTPYVTLVAVIAIGATLIPARAGTFTTTDPRRSAHSCTASQSAFKLVQDSDDDSDSEVPSDQVEKYVAVYKDMQRDRNLTVATAAAKEGLTVAGFRDLEQKVEKDESAREHARTELQAAVSAKP